MDKSIVNNPESVAPKVPVHTAIFFNDDTEASFTMDTFRLHEGMLCFYLQEKLVLAVNPQNVSHFGPGALRVDENETRSERICVR